MAAYAATTDNGWAVLKAFGQLIGLGINDAPGDLRKYYRKQAQDLVYGAMVR